MKKIWLSLTVAALIVFTLGLLLAEAADVIRIGSIYPLTGAIASSGIRSKHAIETAVDVINNKYDMDVPFARTQGIPNLKGAKLEVIWGDSQASPEVGKTEAERLITREKVPLIIGAYQSGVSKAASFVAERYKIPFLDGHPGMVYAILQSFYEYLIVLKVRELTSAHHAGVEDSKL